MLRIKPYLQSTNKVWECFRKAVYFSSIIMSIVSAYILFKYFVVDYVSFNETTSEIQKVWENVSSSNNNKINENDENNDVNHNNGNNSEYLNKFSELIKINPDIKGWIKIDGTVINYPVLEPPSSDPNFYLYKNYKKDYDKSGCIFVNSDICGLTPDVKNIVLHGHSMKNGTMFASIIKFSDKDVYKRSPIINFDTIFESAKWKIFAVIKTNSNPDHGELFYDYFKPTFESSYEFNKLIYDMKIRSILDIPVDVNENDKLLTLSTCSYEMEGFRTVVMARKVRQGESLDIDLNNVKVNNNPKMPDGWYKSRKMNIPNFKSYDESLESNT